MADNGLSLFREGAAYAYLIYQVLYSRMDAADFVLYFGVITGFSTWTGSVLGQLNTLKRISMSFDYLRNFLEYPEPFRDEGGISTKELLSAPETIELRGVSYRYEGAETDVLHDISLTIRPGSALRLWG